MSDRVHIVSVRRHGAGPDRNDQDLVAVEAPLSIEVQHVNGAAPRRLGVMMRTPGDDRDLVLGLLVTEGLVRSASDIVGLDFSEAPDEEPDAATAEEGATLVASVARVTLSAEIDLTSRIGDMGLVTSSACGLCGRLDVRQAERGGAASAPQTTFDSTLLARLPSSLRNGQTVFAETGGLHAAALADHTGRVRWLREDVGRHNAVDKVIGAAFDAGATGEAPLLVVSSRVAFEIVQKAAMAGIAGIVAVGAPSSLAVRAARSTGLTLVGFARDGRFNVYSGHERIR